MSVAPDNHLQTTQIPMSTSTEFPTTTVSSIETTTNFQVAQVIPAQQMTTRFPLRVTTEDILINLITITTPPTTSALPVATGIRINKTTTYNVKNPQLEFGDTATSAAMVDMACKMRAQKPMYSVLCDLAKSVYRTQT